MKQIVVSVLFMVAFLSLLLLSRGADAQQSSSSSAGAGAATSETKTAPLTGEDILKAMDKNRDFKTITYEGVMEIHVRKQIRTKTMTVRGRVANKKSIVEFTNPEDQGTKYLMLDDNLWIYFPDEDDTVKISGHMLKEGMMGSDVSYEDALEGDTLADKYNIKLTGEETYDKRPCYVITLTAKVKKVPYAKRIMWVDKEYFVAYKEQMFAKSGKLLKESNVLEVKDIEGRHYPVRMEMASKLKKNSKTVFIMKKLAFDEEMPEELFTHRFLQR